MRGSQRVQLALLNNNAYLYLARLKPMCQRIMVQTFGYYNFKEASPVPPDQFNPFDFTPYIDLGYGRAQEIVIGSLLQVSSVASLDTTLDLSIVLVQVAMCLSYQYDSGTATSMEAAQSWVQTCQTCQTGGDLDYLLPLDFAEIVRDCVEHDAKAQSIPGLFKKDLETENNFLLAKVSRLQELESRFSTTK
jgi:hypothetical protein